MIEILRSSPLVTAKTNTQMHQSIYYILRLFILDTKHVTENKLQLEKIARNRERDKERERVL